MQMMMMMMIADYNDDDYVGDVTVVIAMMQV